MRTRYLSEFYIKYMLFYYFLGLIRQEERMTEFGSIWVLDKYGMKD